VLFMDGHVSSSSIPGLSHQPGRRACPHDELLGSAEARSQKLNAIRSQYIGPQKSPYPLFKTKPTITGRVILRVGGAGTVPFLVELEADSPLVRCGCETCRFHLSKGLRWRKAMNGLAGRILALSSAKIHSVSATGASPFRRRGHRGSNRAVRRIHIGAVLIEDLDPEILLVSTST
jgi:hypothetical protein